MMGSIRQHGMFEAIRHDVNVVIVGDAKVGKTQLVNKFVNDKFSESYKATSFEKSTTTSVVANRRVRFNIYDTSEQKVGSPRRYSKISAKNYNNWPPPVKMGSHTSSTSRTLAFSEADVFLLCYKISEPTTLFSLLNFWYPEIRISSSPSAQIILVGCQSDTRNNRDVLEALARQGRAPVSAEQALSFSQEIGAIMYVETSSRKKKSSTSVSVFEVAALASTGQLSRNADGQLSSSSSANSTISSMQKKKKQRFSTISPQNSLERSIEADDEDEDHYDDQIITIGQLESTEQFWEQFHHHHNNNHRSKKSNSMTRGQSECPKTPSLSSSSRSASLSSKATTRSSCISIPSSLSSGVKTPKSSRKSAPLKSSKSMSSCSSSTANGSTEKMITIKCQRLRPDKTYEEIDVEVPAPIYETIQMYNQDPTTIGSLTPRTKERRSFGHKLKNLFTSKI